MWNSDLNSEALDVNSLQWQTWAKLNDPSIVFLNVSNHASPDEKVPFIQIESRKLVLNPSLLQYFLKDESTLQQISPWMSLLINQVETAILLTMYLDNENFSEIQKKWLPNMSWPLNIIKSIGLPSQIKRKICLQLNESTLDFDAILEDASKAFSALSELLGSDKWFFNNESPSFLDVSLFAHAEIINHLPLKNDQLKVVLGTHKNLTDLTTRVRTLAGYTSAGPIALR
ncbi:Metaxin-1 [Schizosaccharomyces pombe]